MNLVYTFSLPLFVFLSYEFLSDKYSRKLWLFCLCDHVFVLLQVSAEETEIFEEVKSLLGENEDKVSQFIAPFPLLSKNAVEALRYRAEVKVTSIIFELKDT